MSTDLKNAPQPDTRLELVVALSIAVVSITLALVAWRNNMVGSAQGDAARQGLIDAIKQQAAASEDWRMVYQEAAFAQSYDAYAAGLKTLLASSDPAAKAEAEQLQQFLLPAMAQLSPMANNNAYRNKDGTYDLEQRFHDIQADNPDLAKLSPAASYKRADDYTSEQRWLTVAVVLLVIALFWLTLAQISGRRLRIVTLVIGGVLYAFTLVGFGIVELVFLVMRMRG